MSSVGDNGGSYNNLQNNDYPGIATLNRTDRILNDGSAFFAGGAGTLSASGGAFRFLGKTGSKLVHLSSFFFRLEKGGVSLKLYENPTITGNGTPVSVKNRNRAKQGIVNNETLVYTNPTYSALGEVIIPINTPKTGGGANVSPALAGSEGWVLKANTPYIFELVNNDSTPCEFSGIFEWSEFESKLIGL